MARWRYLIISIALIAFAGCRPGVGLTKLHPVKGTVSKAGEPINVGRFTLKLNPDNPDVKVTAFIEPNGTFEVVSTERDGKKRVGAAPGNYRLTYLPREQGADPIEIPQLFTVEAKANEWTIDLAPKK